VVNRFRSINTVIGEAAITDESIERVTRAINGGINGLPARITHTRRIASVVNDEAP
jgi:predicted chitinase